MIYDAHKLIQIATPKTGTSCVFNMIHAIPLHIIEIPTARATSFPEPEPVVGPLPATAGLTLETPQITEGHPLFDYYKHGHVSYQRYENVIAEYPRYKKYKYFTFTRNPYDIMVSNYFYAARGAPEIECADLPFKKYVWGLLNGIPEMMSGPAEEWIIQVDYLKNKEGNIEMNFIGKLENLEEDWDKLRELVPTLPEYNNNYRKSNISKKRYSSGRRLEFSELYDTETQKLVLKYFEEDFDIFHYPKSFPLPSSSWNWPFAFKYSGFKGF